MSMQFRFDEYEDWSRRTRGTFRDLEKGLAVVALGLAGEAGEVAEKVKKLLGHGHGMDNEGLIDELGDVLFYLCWMANLADSNLETVAMRNIEKLRKRYPEGFSHEASLNRKE